MKLAKHTPFQISTLLFDQSDDLSGLHLFPTFFPPPTFTREAKTCKVFLHPASEEGTYVTNKMDWINLWRACLSRLLDWKFNAFKYQLEGSTSRRGINLLFMIMRPRGISVATMWRLGWILTWSGRTFLMFRLHLIIYAIEPLNMCFFKWLIVCLSIASMLFQKKCLHFFKTWKTFWCTGEHLHFYKGLTWS